MPPPASGTGVPPPQIDFNKYKLNKTPPPAPIAPPAPIGNRFLKSLQTLPSDAATELGGITGAAKTLAKPLVNTGGAIESGLDETLGRGINALKGNGFKPTKSGSDAFKAADTTLVPQGTQEKVGGVVGDVAPYFIPVAGADAAATKAAEVVAPKAASVAAKVGSKALGGIIKAAPRIVQNAGIALAQTRDAADAAVVAAGGEFAEGVGAVAKAVGKGLFKASIPVSAEEAVRLQAYRAGTTPAERMAGIAGKEPNTAGDVAFRTKNMMGTESMIGVQAAKGAKTLWDKVISPALDKTPTKVDMSTFFKDAETQIMKDTPELGDKSSRLNALEAIKEEYKSAIQTGGTSMKDLQSFKEGWASHVPEKAYRGKDITGAYNNVRATLASLARTNIYEAVGPEVQQAYLDYGNMQGLKELGQKAMTGAKLKGGAGSFVSGLTEKIVVPVATIGGKTLYKTGEGIEFLGAAGAKTLQDLLGKKDQGG